MLVHPSFIVGDLSCHISAIPFSSLEIHLAWFVYTFFFAAHQPATCDVRSGEASRRSLEFLGGVASTCGALFRISGAPFSVCFVVVSIFRRCVGQVLRFFPDVGVPFLVGHTCVASFVGLCL